MPLALVGAALVALVAAGADTSQHTAIAIADRLIDQDLDVRVPEVNVGGALDAVLSAITGREHTSAALRAERTEQGRRTFSVRAGTTSVGEVLDAIVRAHGDAWWELRLGVVRPNEVGPVIMIWTHDGTGLGAPAVPFSDSGRD